MNYLDILHTDILEPSGKMEILEAKQMEPIGRHLWADCQFDILKKYIQEFEKSLDAEHEVGIQMTNFGQSILMLVSDITFENPVLMIFKGSINNREATLIQHINQLNFILTSVEKDSDRPKRQIGFKSVHD